MRPLTTPVTLRQARQHLLESGQCPRGLVDARLAPPSEIIELD